MADTYLPGQPGNFAGLYKKSLGQSNDILAQDYLDLDNLYLSGGITKEQRLELRAEAAQKNKERVSLPKPIETITQITPGLSEEKKQPPKEEVFEKLLNKINTPQKEQTIDAFGRGSTYGDYTPQEEVPTRGRVDAFGSSEKETVQAASKTKANDFLEAYKGVIETNTPNNRNEDIAAVYKPSVPPVETWQEKLEKDAIRNQNKPIPTGVPYRRGTGLGDHMGADAGEEINNTRGRQDAFSNYNGEEEQPMRGRQNAFGNYNGEEEQPTRGRQNAFDPYQYYA